MYEYKVKGDLELTIPGVGITVDGKISSHYPIENPNLELVSSPEVEASSPADTNVQGVTEPAAPGHVAGVAPQAQQPTPAVEQPQTPTESEQA